MRAPTVTRRDVLKGAGAAGLAALAGAAPAAAEPSNTRVKDVMV